MKNLLYLKHILRTLPSSGIKNYIKIRKGSVLEKQQLRNSTKWKNFLQCIYAILFFGMTVYTNN